MKNEVRLIDANAIPWCNYDLDNYHSFVGVEKEYVDDMPTIDPESLRLKGRWIVEKRHSVSSNPYIDDNYHIRVTCSECGYLIQSEIGSFGYPKLKTTKFCPDCGAKMEE